MRAELTIAALWQKPPPGLIHHSDRGSQYAAGGYRKLLSAAGMIQSMSHYNRQRLHSALGYITPEQAERHAA
jgi:putative transposase